MYDSAPDPLSLPLPLNDPDNDPDPEPENSSTHVPPFWHGHDGVDGAGVVLVTAVWQ